VGRVSYLAYKTGNELKFSNFGDEELEKNISNTKPKKEVIEGLDEEDMKFVEAALKLFKGYVAGAIFTDKFLKHRNFGDLEDLNTRLGWEKANIYGDGLKKEDLDYYKSNRVNMGSRINPTVGHFSHISEMILNEDIKTKLQELGKQIPEEIKNAELYENLAHNERVDRVNKFSEILKKAIDILEEKT